MIPFHIPYKTGKEINFISEAINFGKWSGDGIFTKKCQTFFEEKFGFKKTFLTTSCTDALEMCAILLNIQPGDEVIVPSYTFVSTANAFILRGAKVIFADSKKDHPNMDDAQLEPLITPNTKAIVVMHYAGIPCQMHKILQLVKKHNLYLIEDAALALGSKHHDQYTGTFGHLSTFSFHETKNISCGEGGLLVVNDERFIKRAEIIREKGTDRSAFFRGEINKYGWVDIGSSFLMSDILAAFLYCQLLAFEEIQHQRSEIWNKYYKELKVLEHHGVILPGIDLNDSHSASIFYLVLESNNKRSQLIQYLKDKGIQTSFHYQSLHQSAYYSKTKTIRLPNSDQFSEGLLRLPLYPDLSDEQQSYIISTIKTFFNVH